MTPDAFLRELQELLRMEAELTMDSILNELDEWDSLAMLSVVSIATNKFGISLNVNDFKNFKTPRDIFNRLLSHDS